MNRPKPTRALGIDYGLKRIGLSLSDERKIIASPLATVQAEKKLDQTVSKLVAFLKDHQEEHGYVLDQIVVGLPLMMSGKVGLIADEVRLFIAELEKQSGLPVAQWDERLTSVMAERTMREASMSRKKQAKIVDKISAVIILQNFLDSKNLHKDSAW